MSDFASVSRRQFVQGAAALMASTPLLTSTHAATAADSAASSGGNDSADGNLYGRLYKTLKIGMVNVPGSLTDKFKAAKAAGFHGIELNAPGFDVTEVREAMAAAEFPVDGTVCSSHWQIRHTSPDANERAQALETLKEAMRKTHAIGGNTVLLVVGHGKDAPQGLAGSVVARTRATWRDCSSRELRRRSTAATLANWAPTKSATK